MMVVTYGESARLGSINLFWKAQAAVPQRSQLRDRRCHSLRQTLLPVAPAQERQAGPDEGRHDQAQGPDEGTGMADFVVRR